MPPRRESRRADPLLRSGCQATRSVSPRHPDLLLAIRRRRAEVVRHLLLDREAGEGKEVAHFVAEDPANLEQLLLFGHECAVRRFLAKAPALRRSLLYAIVDPLDDGDADGVAGDRIVHRGYFAPGRELLLGQ